MFLIYFDILHINVGGINFNLYQVKRSLYETQYYNNQISISVFGLHCKNLNYSYIVLNEQQNKKRKIRSKWPYKTHFRTTHAMVINNYENMKLMTIGWFTVQSSCFYGHTLSPTSRQRLHEYKVTKIASCQNELRVLMIIVSTVHSFLGPDFVVSGFSFKYVRSGHVYSLKILFFISQCDLSDPCPSDCHE